MRSVGTVTIHQPTDAEWERFTISQGGASANTSHLRTAHRKFRCQRIKHLDKIEELLSWLEWLRWRYPTFLRFVLMIDLLDLPTVDAQPTHGQHMACHLVPQALEQRHDRLLWLYGERKREHLGQFKESFTKAQPIRVQFCLHRCLGQERPHGIMGQVDAVEFLAHPLPRLGAEDLALPPLRRFD